MKYVYDKAFLTGCDETTEWMLPWFVGHYRKHQSTPLVFANFGVTPRAHAFMEQQCECMIDMTQAEEKGWFKKPKAMIACPSLNTVWIDTDCQVMANCDKIFDKIVPNKLLMVEDKPWSKRREEKWHNSGIVGFHKKPNILHQWARQVKLNPEVGDQEVLHSILNPITKMTFIEDLDNRYNVLRIQVEMDGHMGPTNIIHWTGQKGKSRIQRMIKDG